MLGTEHSEESLNLAEEEVEGLWISWSPGGRRMETEAVQPGSSRARVCGISVRLQADLKSVSLEAELRDFSS